jgi:hypothetical protein
MGDWPKKRLASLLLSALGVAGWAVAEPAPEVPSEASGAGCPRDMVRVRNFCIDRFEASLVDDKSGRALSPYYPPHPALIASLVRLWQVEKHQVGDLAARNLPLPPLPEVQQGSRFQPRAVSRPGVVPQGYLSYSLAELACKNADKRLCTEDEWVTACRGARQTKFPYGTSFELGACNVYRYYHPAFLLHGNSSVGHTDPRLNLILERGKDPVLRLTGATERCTSHWGAARIHDMVGNLDEWVSDEGGVFVGGFYARATREGCEARISSHSPQYYDYSLGTRCCRNAR